MSDIIDRSNRKLGQASITNSAGDRDVYIQGSLGDEETFVNALATTSFMLQRIPGTNTYKRFDGKVVPVDSSGTEIFTDSNPGSIKLTGSITGKGALATVTTAGTRVQLPSFACRIVTVIAKLNNAGSIYASPDNLVSATNYGVELKAGSSYDFEVANTNQIYIDASVDGEGISYVAL